MSSKNNGKELLLSAAIVALAALLSYSPLLFGGGWFSDDYMQVYGLHGQPLPSLKESILQAGAGSISVARTFSRAIMGYGGFFLGESSAMAVRVAGHALNAILFFLFLTRLPIARSLAFGSSLIFASAPWHTQAVVWWATVHLGLATTFILLALLAYQSWLERGVRWRLLLSQALVFASLMTYEQALASWLVFFGVALLQPGHLEDLQSRRWVRAFQRVFAVSWPMLIPFALWTVLYLASFPLASNTRTPKLSIERNLITLASTHFRWFDSAWHRPWGDLWRQGIASITPLAATLMGLFAIGAAWLLGRPKGRTASESRSNELPLMIVLVFSYLLFAGFRLVFVMQGATSTESRNSYGADLGVALAFAAVAYFVLVSKLRRPTLYGLLVTVFCLANVVVTRGEARHTALNVQDERFVFEKAVDALAADPQASSLTVVVMKPLTKGEKNLYEEFGGGWLAYRLEKQLGRKIKVHISRDANGASATAAASVILR